MSPSAPAPTLHAYQAEGIARLRAEVLEGRRRVLLVAPTGAGKTVLLAALIASAVELGSRVLIIVHRLELVTQMAIALSRRGISVGVIRAAVPPEPIHRVQVATIQTLARRDLPPAEIVIVDEAHRAAADSYETVRAAYPNAAYIGATATPCRENGRPLGDVFNALVEVTTYSALIALNHDEPTKGIAEPICYAGAGGQGPDLESVHTRGGDYVVGELEIAMNKTELVGGIVDNWRRYAEGRLTLAFAVGVEHSRAIAAAFTAAGVIAAHLDGETPEVERAATLERFARGEITVLSNCALFIEGLDIPAAKCAILARPTKSLALYMQGVGRVLRPWRNVRPIVLDHAGNITRHGLPHEDRDWSLTEPAKRRATKAPYKTCSKCFGYIAASARTCPLCGASLAEIAAERKELPRETSETLQRIDAQIANERRKKAERDGEEKRRYFDQLAEQAQHRGFKPGYASAKWKEKYNAWPPWAWSQELKARFAADESWQERQREREDERAYWQARKAATAAPEQHDPGDYDAPAADASTSEHAFADLFEGF